MFYETRFALNWDWYIYIPYMLADIVEQLPQVGQGGLSDRLLLVLLLQHPLQQYGNISPTKMHSQKLEVCLC